MEFCTYCGAEVTEDTIVCSKCGCKIGTVPKTESVSQVGKSTLDLSDILLVIYAGIIFLSPIIIGIVGYFFEMGLFGNTLFTIAGGLFSFLPVVVIKNKTIKIIGIICVAIPVIYWIIFFLIIVNL
ncbi:hypothetical protein FACS189485_20150 [Spirochaetia bacterium]|nr:hypothetical protein FACS189485_20150 [Spirochaetia bacterium]